MEAGFFGIGVIGHGFFQVPSCRKEKHHALQPVIAFAFPATRV